MFLTGFTDEAGPSLEEQIKATKELGWNYISLRNINGKNIHEIPEKEFEVVCQTLADNDIKVAEMGSLIGNWSKNIQDSFKITLAEVQRAISRMKKLNCPLVRIMSYKQEVWGNNQFEQERFSRLKKITELFHNEGLIVAHENCMNWGGFSIKHTLKLIEEVPNLKLIFDTGNPVFQRDRNKDEPHPWQSSFEFYNAIKEHIVHIHIKDCIMTQELGEPAYVFPGEGDGDVTKIIKDLKSNNYIGGIAIEPHVATVFHMKEGKSINWQESYSKYIKYGKQLEEIIKHN